MSVTEESAGGTAIRPFTVEIPEAEIEALCGSGAGPARVLGAVGRVDADIGRLLAIGAG